MLDNDTYYIADYGAMLVGMKDDRIKNLLHYNYHLILTIFPQLISHFELNHVTVLRCYLLEKGYKVVLMNMVVKMSFCRVNCGLIIQ